QSGEATGMHSPLYEGSEVIIGFLQGDDRQPFIVGALPNSQNTSPVVAKNKYQHWWRTPGDQSLLMDDSENNQKIEMSTYQNLNHLTLSAIEKNQGIFCQTSEGSMTFQADKNIRIQTQQNLIEKIQNQKQENTQQSYFLELKKELYINAARHFLQRAHQ